jgi:light-regulated signal transduction histidine kinase (bacteriophytochrome)
VSEPLPPIRIRSTHLLQLWQNLLANALKYRSLDRKCVIRISARRRGADWFFSVSDNGIGFDPAYAQHIFGVFKRLHGRVEYPGSGIGLAICARIVHTYGGRIWAEGRLGQGATVFFSLPAIHHAR